MKKALSALLSLLMLLSAFVFPASPAAAAEKDGAVIYSEDFERPGLTGNDRVLSALGWSLSEEFTRNTAQYSLQDGALICDNLDSTVGSSVDSYVTILDDAQMAGAAGGSYTISYDVTYLAAGNANRYAALIYNYNGYQNYNSVHIRVGGTGNNQLRAYGSTWMTYDENAADDAPNYLASKGQNSVAQKVFGVPVTTSAPYALLNRTLTVTIRVDAEKGPSVFINGILVSEPTGKYNEMYLSSRQYSSAVALKTSLKVKAKIDNILIYTGLGALPADRTPTRPAPSEPTERSLRVMSLNTLYSNYNDVAFSDGVTRSQHMVSLIDGIHPDVIGLQERASGLKTYMTDLLVSSCGYACVDEYRTDTTRTGILMETPIFYNKNKFELVANSSSNGNLAHGNFIYSASYQTTGKTIGASSTYTKSLAWGVLRSRETGQLVLAMNTHQAVYTDSYNNYTSEDAVRDRVKNAEQALEQIEKIYAQFGALPTFYTGDFNMRQNEESYRLLETRFSDAVNCAPDAFRYEYSMSNNSSTITDPGFLRAPNSPIDHIFFTPQSLTALHYEVLNDSPEMMIATDHLGIYTDFALAKVSAPVCSHATGIFSGLQRVRLTGNGIFFFTTDGSDPRTSGTRKTYSSFIPVSADTELRFCAYLNGIYSPMMRVTLFFGTPFRITEAIKNTSSNDHYEGIELFNISGVPIDLYDFRLWQYTGSDAAAVKNAAPASVTANMRLCETEGEHIVAPGELVYIYIVFSDSYCVKRKISGSKSVYITEMDPETSRPIYRTDYVAQAINYDRAGFISAERLIPLDRTAQSFGYTPDGTAFARRDCSADKMNAVSNLGGAFNLGNGSYNRLYTTFANAPSVADAFCINDLDGTGNGTWLNGSALTAKEGAYSYLPDGDSPLMRTSFTEKSYTIGSLNSSQKAQYMAQLRSDNYTYTCRPGDTDGEGSVNSADVLLLRSYFANFDYNAGTSSVGVAAGADADCSGEVTNSDLLLLRRYLANYDYSTNTSSVRLGKQS